MLWETSHRWYLRVLDLNPGVWHYVHLPNHIVLTDPHLAARCLGPASHMPYVQLHSRGVTYLLDAGIQYSGRRCEAAIIRLSARYY